MKPLIIDGPNHVMHFLLMAMHDYQKNLTDLVNRNPSIHSSLQTQFDLTKQCMAVISQSIKDNQFEESQLPIKE